MENNVTTLETSKKLARLRDDRTMFAWVETESEAYITDYESALHARQIAMYAAYVADEMAHIFSHSEFHSLVSIYQRVTGYSAVITNFGKARGFNMAEALAALWLKLAPKSPKEVNDD